MTESFNESALRFGILSIKVKCVFLSLNTTNVSLLCLETTVSASQCPICLFSFTIVGLSEMFTLFGIFTILLPCFIDLL